MRVKQILSDVRLVIAEIEVSLNGTLRSNSTLCAVVTDQKEGVEQVIPLNTPDGRPILMNRDNAIIVAK
jgi:cytochrome oxidase assembly protein ShyY1